MIEAFYAALFAKDGAAVGALIDEHFAPDAVLWRPESLPGGGRTEGAENIKRFMLGAMRMSGPPLDIGDMRLVQVVGTAAELAFPFAGIETGALERWNVGEDGKVREIRAYYWDTAAMLRAVG